MSARRFGRPARHVVVGTVYVLLMVVVAAVAAWPIYRTVDYVVLVVSAVVVGGVIAALTRILG